MYATFSGFIKLTYLLEKKERKRKLSRKHKCDIPKYNIFEKLFISKGTYFTIALRTFQNSDVVLWVCRPTQKSLHDNNPVNLSLTRETAERTAKKETCKSFKIMEL